MTRRAWIGSVALLAAILASSAGLAAWKYASIREATAIAAGQPEPVEWVGAAVAEDRLHRPTTTVIGTILALRSITLQNELAGTVRTVSLTPGQVVEPGAVLVALDVSVEEAELKALQAQAVLADAAFARVESLSRNRWVSEADFDRARAERDVAVAQIARIRAVIERKTIRAPFRARVGIADVHPGQYLEEGTVLTTLQGVEAAVHLDFDVEQRAAARLRPGDTVDVFAHAHDANSVAARIVAVDARVDPRTRNAMVRARIEDAAQAPAPGSSVRVRVPLGPPRTVIAVPASALRKGPEGTHVFVLLPEPDGRLRAHARSVDVEGLSGDEALILAGLAPGDRVAASGSFKLRDAALVSIAPDPVVSANPAVSAGTVR